MRITKIDNANRQSVTFGYSKGLNVALKKNLTREVSDFNQMLSGLNTLCNKTEDKIIKRTKFFGADESGHYDDETESLLDFFIDIKTRLAELVDQKYPHLRYSKREANHYKKLAAKEDVSWRDDVVDNLDEIAENKLFESDTIQIHDEINGDELPLDKTKPMPKKEIITETIPTSESPLGFKSIGGMEKLKESFFDNIIFPIKNPEIAKLDELEYGKKMPRASLLVGPPGCGKTFIAEAIAREAGVPFYEIKLGKQGSSFINQTSVNLSSSFDAIEQKGKEINKPCIVFFDELDGIAADRSNDRASESKIDEVNTLLDIINNARSRGIIILGASNNYKKIDKAILSRFDNVQYVGLPDKETRKEVLKKTMEGRLKALSLLNSPQDLEEVAEKLDKFSNRGIVDIANAATNIARKNGRRDLQKEDFFKIISERQSHKINNESEYKITNNKNNRNPIGFQQQKQM